MPQTLEKESLMDSIIEFEDKYTCRNTFSGEDELDDEEIRCRIQELYEGERVVLNAFGSWEVHHYDNYRRRLGIYFVVSKRSTIRQGPATEYTLREEREFSQSKLVSLLLSGNCANILEDIKGLRYIELDKFGRRIPTELHQTRDMS